MSASSAGSIVTVAAAASLGTQTGLGCTSLLAVRAYRAPRVSSTSSSTIGLAARCRKDGR